MKNWNCLTTEQKIERWQQALRVLQGLSRHERREHWDMSTYGEKTDCGTIACAAGFCGLDPWFRRRGFKMLWKEQHFAQDEADGNGMAFATRDFFGRTGASSIFWNGTRRSVGQVIYEVKAYIRGLKAGRE